MLPTRWIRLIITTDRPDCRVWRNEIFNSATLYYIVTRNNNNNDDNSMMCSTITRVSGGHTSDSSVIISTSTIRREIFFFFHFSSSLFPPPTPHPPSPSFYRAPGSNGRFRRLITSSGKLSGIFYGFALITFINSCCFVVVRTFVRNVSENGPPRDLCRPRHARDAAAIDPQKAIRIYYFFEFSLDRAPDRLF